MPQHDNPLVWIDLEMTGLDPMRDRILEIATLVTDSDLNLLAEGPVLAIHQPEPILEAMDQWNKTHHGASGLIARVRASRCDEPLAERETLAFVEQWVAAGRSPICGNSVCQDRRFLARWMPHLEAHFHYRSLDVSTPKVLMQRWRPDLEAGFTKAAKHQALDDIKESVAELRYYREHFFRLR
jgi:oligoribonuclease